MATEHWMGIALAAALALFVLTAWRSHARRGGIRLPSELRKAELVFAEQQFHTTGPLILYAKLDRAYRRHDGVFVLLELKTRAQAKVYLSDVIELSAQRVALSTETSMPVAKHGYVLVHGPDGRQLACHRVTLLSDEQVRGLAWRRSRLLMGATVPRANGAPHLCRGCEQRGRCTVGSGAL